jgi:single-strand DNA-binding protein
MASFNKVILMGNLTRDPESRHTPKGTAVCDFSLAMNRRRKDQDGNQMEEVCFVECTCFGAGAENFQKYMAKGKSVLVDGRLVLDSWEDKQTGAKRSKLKVIVETFQFLGGNPNHHYPAADGPSARGSGSGAATAPGAEAAAVADPSPEAEDDVPF